MTHFVSPDDVARSLGRVTPSLARPAAITASELKAKVFRPVPWVVPGLVADGLTMLAGKPKIGKSWLMLDIAVAVATGGSVLGRQCFAGDVLYAALEDNERRLKERMSRLCPLGEWPSRLTFWTKMERLEQGGLHQLQDWIGGAVQPRLAIIDVFSKVRRIRRGNEGVYDADYLSATPLKALADETGVGTLAVHHLRKNTDGADPLDGVSGSTGLTGAADTILVLDRATDGVTLCATGRDVERTELAVSFDIHTCRWSALGNAHEVRLSGERRAIVDALRNEAEPLAPAAIAGVTGQKRVNVRRLLGAMALAGEVHKVERGKYVLPFPPEHR